MVVYLILALAAGVAGLACLFGSWQGRIPRRLRPRPLGWGLLVVSAWLCCRALGVEFGVSLALFAVSLIAWLFVAFNLEHRRLRARREQRAPAAPDTAQTSTPWAAHAGLFVVAVPLAAVAATLLAVALSMMLPWQKVNATLLVVVLVPVLWGAAAYWACADARPLRPTLALLACTVVFAGVVYL